MKSKLVIFATLAVMIAMTEIAAAAAATITVTNDPVSIAPGTTGTQNVIMTLDPVENGAIKKIEIIDLPSGIEAKIDGYAGTSLSGTWTSPKTWIVYFTNNAAKNGEYVITYKVKYQNGVQTRRATIEAGISAIPEFPTVTMPIAVVIGLVFLFQSRKNKKE